MSSSETILKTNTTLAISRSLNNLHTKLPSPLNNKYSKHKCGYRLSGQNAIWYLLTKRRAGGENIWLEVMTKGPGERREVHMS